MTPPKPTLQVKPVPGRPLYQSARDTLKGAIDAGLYQPGQQIPSTQALSEQLRVSLVTAHRALQELVAAGVLHRTQGRGTFVNPRYFEQKATLNRACVGLVIERGVSIGDYYHGQIFEGVRQAARSAGVDLILLSYGEDPRRSCDGYIFVNPLRQDLEAFVANASRRKPIVVAGAKSNLNQVSFVDVDNVGLARTVVEHLHSLGHRQLGFISGNKEASNSWDRHEGFMRACEDLQIATSADRVVEVADWQLTPQEAADVTRMLRQDDRPTAIFAAGYYYALAVYAAAAEVGLRIPDDLSVVGVDDPPSATHLSPSLTTFRQPLDELGKAGLDLLLQQIDRRVLLPAPLLLPSKLIVRESIASVR